ncbi:hypothetical protein L208DRAFT_1389347 [Tricholoma matsutake]|nr:hypothetical protein L208DRAFT_1389347 [Tricholoma matsutake 945]
MGFCSHALSSPPGDEDGIEDIDSFRYRNHRFRILDPTKSLPLPVPFMSRGNPISFQCKTHTPVYDRDPNQWLCQAHTSATHPDIPRHITSVPLKGR